MVGEGSESGDFEAEDWVEVLDDLRLEFWLALCLPWVFGL